MTGMEKGILATYIAGVVSMPLLYGFFFGPSKGFNESSWMLFLSLIWPVIIAFALLCGVCMAVVYLPAKLVGLLMLSGYKAERWLVKLTTKRK